MPATFDYRFEDCPLLPSYKGADGRMHRYGDQWITGTAEIAADSDGDWWIASITLETSELAKPVSVSTPRYVMREIPRTDPHFGFIRDAIARECEEAINEAVRLNQMDNTDYALEDLIERRRLGTEAA